MVSFSKKPTLLVVNPAKDPGLMFAGRVQDFLRTFHMSAKIITTIALEQNDVPDGYDGLWVTLGGDGTMLLASHHAACAGAVLFGINLGNLGYLTSAKKDHGLIALRQVIEGQGSVACHMMLLAGYDAPMQNRLALNEAVLHGGGRMLDYDLHINNEHIYHARADGVIICTKTGSTAYNKSAGGPGLLGENLMAITPICSATPNVTSVVVPGGVVSITVEHEANLLLDGVLRKRVLPGTMCFEPAPNGCWIFRVFGANGEVAKTVRPLI